MQEMRISGPGRVGFNLFDRAPDPRSVTLSKILHD
jgi:hypothetical protein